MLLIVSVFALTSLLLSLFALGFSMYLFIELKAAKNSTHQFTILDPSKQEFEKITEEMKKEADKPPAEYQSIF